MFLDALPVIRDIAVVFLVLQWLLLLAVPLFILWKIVAGLRRFLPQVRLGIRVGHGYVRQGLGYVDQCMAYVRSPFVWLNKSLLSASERTRKLESTVTRRVKRWRE